MDRKLAGWDEAQVAAVAQRKEPPAPTEEQAGLLAHRRRLQDRLGSPEQRAAELTVLAAARERGRTGETVSERDVAEWRARRARELGELPATHEANLRAAGIDPRVYEQSAGAERAALERRLAQSLAAEQVLLRAASGDGATRTARIQFDPREIRARSAQERLRLRRERAAKRARANLFRPR